MTTLNASNIHKSIRGKYEKKKKNDVPEVHLMELSKMLKLDKPPPKPPLPRHKDIFESNISTKLSSVVKTPPVEKKRLLPYQRKD